MFELKWYHLDLQTFNMIEQIILMKNNIFFFRMSCIHENHKYIKCYEKKIKLNSKKKLVTNFNECDALRQMQCQKL